jgi:Resolvase, N terminal domain
MRAAVYARVSTTRQAQAQTIQQQLDRLRDQAALAELDLVLVTAPDRLARNYVHQVLLLDELGRHGLKVEFLDRPMSHDPHDQLLPGDPRGGRRVRAHADHRADAPGTSGQAAGGHAAALDHAAVRLPARPQAAPGCGRGPGGAGRGGVGRAAV